MRVREAWVSQVDGERVVELFIAIIQKQGKVAGGAPSDMWSNADVEAAGALFLMAWEANRGPSGELPLSGSEMVRSDRAEWMANNTISAFTIWLQTFEKHGTISIKEKDDDTVFIRTTIDLELVHSYVERAKAENHPAVEQSGLNEAIVKLMKGQLRTVAQETATKVKVIRAFQLPSTAERLSAAVAKKRPSQISSTQSPHVLPLHTSEDTTHAEGSKHASRKDRKIGT
ncbi:hypothetical protein FRB95_001174 [Tulasnella sp. JGI-2019a]|nr:hypothetical protein FRB95_001174 [Tulasnella sp. JGI-2019a]